MKKFEKRIVIEAINDLTKFLKIHYGTCKTYQIGCAGCEATRVIVFLKQTKEEIGGGL
jgi:hypothetical protein